MKKQSFWKKFKQDRICHFYNVWCSPWGKLHQTKDISILINAYATGVGIHNILWYHTRQSTYNTLYNTTANFEVDWMGRTGEIWLRNWLKYRYFSIYKTTPKNHHQFFNQLLIYNSGTSNLSITFPVDKPREYSNQISADVVMRM